MQSFRRLARIFLNILIPVTAIMLIIWLLPGALRFFGPFVAGGIIALVANPLVRFLERKVKLRRKFGTVLIIGGALALVIVGGYAVLSRLARELIAFATDLPAVLEGAGDQLQLAFARLEAMASRLPGKLPVGLDESLEALGNSIVEAVKEFAGNLGAPTMQAAGNFAKSIPSVFVMVVITILSAYFFLAEKETVATVYRRMMPKKLQEYLGLLRRNIKKLVGGYFLAQFKIMGVVAAILIAGFLILRVSYAAIWAVLIALLDFLPVFGTGTILIPWAILELISGRVYMGIGLAACWLTTQAVRQMIQPKVVGDSMGLDPLLTLFFLYLGFRFNGIGGMIVAVPVGMIVIEFYKYGAFDSLIGAVKELVSLVNAFRQTDGTQKEEKQSEQDSQDLEKR